jgi:hypothetical protein
VLRHISGVIFCSGYNPLKGGDHEYDKVQCATLLSDREKHPRMARKSANASGVHQLDTGRIWCSMSHTCWWIMQQSIVSPVIQHMCCEH